MKFMDKVNIKDLSNTEMGVSKEKKSLFGFYWSIILKLLQKTAKGVIIESKKVNSCFVIFEQPLNKS